MKKINCNLCSSSKATFLLAVKERLLREDTFDIVQCRHCGLIYTNPRPKSEEIGKYYPEGYSGFQFSYPEPLFPGESKFLRKIKNVLKKKILEIHYGYFSNFEEELSKNNFLKVITLPFKHRIGYFFPPYKKSGRILDIGCATGHYLAKVRELGWETYGIEMDKKSASWAKEKLGLNVVAGEFSEANFPSNYFDVVTFWHSLEHLPDPSSALKKVYEILKMNGLVIIGIPNVATLETRIFGRWWWGWEVPRHLYHFSCKTIVKLLNKEGFRVIRIEYPPDVNNIILSLRIFLLDHFPKKENWMRRFFDPGENPKLYSFLMPSGYFLSLTRQVGRIVVYGQKSNAHLRYFACGNYGQDKLGRCSYSP